MRVLSLFDGISCGRVALERAGIKVDQYTAYEIDENAIKVSSKNYPDIEHKGDVFKAQYEEGSHDLLIGGSPCTYWSIAKAKGRETSSSGLGFELFSQYVRALKEVKPRFFLYENNESMSDEIKDEITKALGVKPVLIDSSDFSAQIRKRYYWTNIPVSTWNKRYIYIKDIFYKDAAREVKSFEKYKDSMIVSQDGNSVKWDSSGKGYYSQQNRARGMEIKMNTITARGLDKCNIWLGDTKYLNIHPVEAERLQTLPDNYTDCVSKVNRIKAVGNRWTVDVIAHILKGLTEV